MKQVSRIDANGVYIEPIAIEEGQEVPADCITIEPPQGLYWPRWDGTQWIEGMSADAIERLKQTLIIPTIEKRLSDVEDALLMMMGV